MCIIAVVLAGGMSPGVAFVVLFCLIRCCTQKPGGQVIYVAYTLHLVLAIWSEGGEFESRGGLSQNKVPESVLYQKGDIRNN